MNKYVKLVILSTFENSKSLSEIGTFWFKNKGRLYQPCIIKEINKAVKDRLLLKGNRGYRPNIDFIVDLVLEDIKICQDTDSTMNYKRHLKIFYNWFRMDVGRIYLNFKIIDELSKGDWKKAINMDLTYLFQLPFLLRFLEYKDSNLACIIVNLLGLKKYVRLIGKSEWQNYYMPLEMNHLSSWFKKRNNVLIFEFKD